MKHNIEYEKRLIDFLNYKLIGPDNSNRWIILDENDNQVGYIQYKRIHKGNKSKETPSVYAYCTVIESSTISYRNERTNINRSGEIVGERTPFYSLTAKKNGITKNIELRLSDNGKGIKIWNSEFDFMKLNIDETSGLYLRFQSQTKSFNLEEVVEYNSNDEYDNSIYYYQLGYCPIDEKITDDNKTAFELEVMHHPEYQKSNEVRIRQESSVNERVENYTSGISKGTVEEVLLRHKMGLEAFSHFRYLLREILPFSEEILDKLHDKETIEKCGLKHFFPEEQVQKTIQ